EREHLEIGEGHERRREEELVGRRVEERAEAALASPAPRDPAVEQIGQGRAREDDERRSRLAVDQERDEDGDQEDPEDREPVGEPHRQTTQSSIPADAADSPTIYGASRPRRRAGSSTSRRTASGSSAARMCSSMAGWLASTTCSRRSASCSSSSVARNAATSSCGSLRMKPTVSVRMNAWWPAGSTRRAAGSSVTKRRSAAVRCTPARRFKSVVLPAFV